MTFESLKKTCMKAVTGVTFDKYEEEDNNINRIITFVLLFKAMSTLISLSEKYNGDIYSTATQYAETYKNIAEGLKGKYLSFKKIKEKINKENISAMNQLTERQISEIYSIYLNRQQILQFSNISFSQYMYNIFSLTANQYSRLEKNHFNIFVPIFRFYQNRNGIGLQDISVEDVDGENPGKIINLSISGISSTQILYDINSQKIPIKKYFYDEKPSNNIKIIDKNNIQFLLK